MTQQAIDKWTTYKIAQHETAKRLRELRPKHCDHSYPDGKSAKKSRVNSTIIECTICHDCWPGPLFTTQHSDCCNGELP